jgi:hypothetical protein
MNVTTRKGLQQLQRALTMGVNAISLVLEGEQPDSGVMVTTVVCPRCDKVVSKKIPVETMNPGEIRCSCGFVIRSS